MTTRLLAVALTLLAHWIAPADARAFCHLTTVDPPMDQLCSTRGLPLAWFDRCSSVALLPRAKNSIPEETIRTTIQRSFDTWSRVTCDGESVGVVGELIDADATESEPRHSSVGSNQNVIMFVDSQSVWRARMNPTAAIGLTSVFHSKKTGRILGADMEINDWNVTLGVCRGTCPPTVTDLENVLTHEVGHYYGLGHVSDEEATMYFQAPAGDVQKRDLAPDDEAGLCDTYPAGTFPSACTGSVFKDMYADDGCGCSVPGHGGGASRGWIGLVFGLLFALGWRHRAGVMRRRSLDTR